MLRGLVAATIIAVSAFAQASDNRFEMKKLEIHDPKGVGEISINYPQLLPAAGGNYQAINAEIQKIVDSYRCERFEGDEDWDYEWTAELEIKGMTEDFVSVEVEAYADCGGAHPSYWSDGFVYDARTGAKLNMDIEMGGFDFNKEWGDGDVERYEKFKKGIASMVIPFLDKETKECLANVDQDMQSALDIVSYGFALEQGTVVVLGIPPHVAHVCSFRARVPYSAARGTIIEGSVLHRWLR